MPYTSVLCRSITNASERGGHCKCVRAGYAEALQMRRSGAVGAGEEKNTNY